MYGVKLYVVFFFKQFKISDVHGKIKYFCERAADNWLNEMWYNIYIHICINV